MDKKAWHTAFLMALIGLFMGLAAIAPGISGSAMAVVFGLYEPITDALAHIWQNFRKKLKFLLPLGVGAAVGMLLFGKLVTYLFLNYPDYTCALFVGLVAGTFPSVFKAASKNGFRWRYLLATPVLAVVTTLATTVEQWHYTGEMGTFPLWMALIAGGIVGVGSVLPGMSASFILMSVGIYEPMLMALNTLDIPRLLMLAVGFCGAVILLTRLVSWLFEKAHGWMSFAAAGMLIGSMIPVIPIPSVDLRGVWMVALTIAGAALSYFLLKLKK